MKQIILFFFLTISLSAQVKGVVKDSISGKPIPYVNIWVENENIGTTSEEDGSFSLDLKEEKKLVFSALGYEVKTVSLKEITTVLLAQKIYEMPEVVVTAPKRTKEIEIGDVKKPSYLPEPQTIPWIHARKFEYSEVKENAKFIKSIKFFTYSHVENGIFRARIFEVKTDGMLGNDLIDEEILVTVKKGKKKTIVDVSRFNLQIPEEGIIVAFESLNIEQNKYEQNVISLKSKKKYKVTNYSPHIGYFYNKSIEHYVYRSGRWLYFNKAYNEKYRNPVPAINLILTN